MKKMTLEQAIDPVVEKAREIIKNMPDWQRRYAEEIIKSATENNEDETQLPKLLY